MDPNAKFERRRHLIIAIPTGFLSACLVFVATGCISAAADNSLWLLPLFIVMPALVLLARLSARHLQAAMHPNEEWGPPEPIEQEPPPPSGDDKIA